VPGAGHQQIGRGGRGQALCLKRTEVAGNRSGIGIEELVAGRLAVVLRHAHEAVLDFHVRLSRAEHVTGDRSVTIGVTLDVNGHPTQASASARGAREAVDRVAARLVRQLDDRHPPRHTTAR
jgi:ribosome-associated translation inhibitor RaiA